jgi:hypothetical protein
MPKIKLEQGSAMFKYNDIGNYGSDKFGESRGLPIYRWTSCECEDPSPKFATVVFKDGLSSCTDTAHYIPVIKSTINSRKTDGSYTNDDKYSYTNSQYLRRKCRLYNKNLPASISTDGKKVYGNCSEDKSACVGEITYKPNNAKFSTQGAVSGGERLLRLKYNTITRDINDNSTCCRRYTSEATQNININKKEQICNRKARLHQHSTVCA